eukprot:CAMPEP_0198285488 /NCGR_PEP_ID=MMETSP1449-20131203/4743_1 /TAXON_ID=420275 /ORGANISM="Attheya septentrionalis, Strain CCMP2084" /LENGTH=235 /DNA_ID=CAMNT_0043982897 /DNA_START=64 /DNA_END=768 /DNA_ORIENTATION=-
MIVRLLLPRVPTLNLNQCVTRTAKVYFSSSHAHAGVDKKTHLMINTLGPDRLGIVSDMTKLVTDVGGSVGESQATKLGSYFSLTMQVSVPSKAAADDLKQSLADESKIGMMSMHSVETDDPKAVQVVVSPSVGGYSGRFVLSGADQPGHVHKVTSLLVKHGLSIDTMDTSEEEAPFGGTTLYHIDGIVTKPAPLAKGFDPDAVREDLEALADSLNCDMSLEDNVGRKERLSSGIW